MITKGIIEQVISKYCVKVRMPVYDKIKSDHTATSTEDLYEARFCTLPNCFCNPQKNDIVYVGFEDNDPGRPIILGYLCRQTEYGTYPDLKVDELIVTSHTSLSTDTTIGNVQAHQIQYLQGLVGNIQGQLDNLNARIQVVEGKV